jgi:hypothetical protein
MDSDKEDLLTKALREELTAAEKQRWDELLLEDGQLRELFAEEAELERALAMLPNVAISSNFTALTVRAALREEPRPKANSSVRWRLFRFAPAMVAVAVLLSAGLFYGYRNSSANRAEMAVNVRSFSEVASVMAASKTPPAEIFQNFDAIQRLSLPADNELDMELLVALQK